MRCERFKTLESPAVFTHTALWLPLILLLLRELLAPEHFRELVIGRPLFGADAGLLRLLVRFHLGESGFQLAPGRIDLHLDLCGLPAITGRLAGGRFLS